MNTQLVRARRLVAALIQRNRIIGCICTMLARDVRKTISSRVLQTVPQRNLRSVGQKNVSSRVFFIVSFYPAGSDTVFGVPSPSPLYRDASGTPNTPKSEAEIGGPTRQRYIEV
jgi:hypothetical protein